MSLKALLHAKRHLYGGSGATLEISEENGKSIITKSIHQSAAKASKLSMQFEWLSKRQSLDNIAKVSKLSRNSSTSCQYALDYYREYETLDTFFDARNTHLAKTVFDQILTFMHEEIYHPKSLVKSEELFLFYLKDKILNKINECSKTSSFLQDITKHRSIIINGVEYQNAHSCYEFLKSSEKIVKMNCIFNQCDIHGDLTFENILIHPDTLHFILIDPNVDNAVSHPMIDYSKLMQSGSSKHEKMKDITNISMGSNAITYDDTQLNEDSISLALKQCLEDILTESEKKNLILHEAIHFARMLPYRQELNNDSLPVYYARLVILLNQYITSCASK
jgi:hypothetical protein